jgi:hypothetical protein
MKPAPQSTNGIWLRSDGITAMQTNLAAQPYLGDMEQIEVGNKLMAFQRESSSYYQSTMYLLKC